MNNEQIVISILTTVCIFSVFYSGYVFGYRKRAKICRKETNDLLKIFSASEDDVPGRAPKH